ncbi:MAG: GspE/PulE/PilB domain-containing protein [Planctomycetota bacterium]|jgi:hypothetical protein
MPKLSRTTRKSLNELLVETGKVSSPTVEEAERQAAAEGVHLTEVLIRKGWISEDEVAALWIRIYGLPYLPPALHDVKEGVIGLFSQHLLQSYCFVPVDVFDDVVVVVAGTGLEDKAVEEIESHCGKALAVMIGRPSDVRQAICRLGEGAER